MNASSWIWRFHAARFQSRSSTGADSATMGTAFGFVTEDSFAGLAPPLALRFPSVLLAVAALVCAAIAFRRLAPGRILDLSKATRSATGAWGHPYNWCFALAFSFVNFGEIPNLDRLAIAHAAKWAMIDFVCFYILAVLVNRMLAPSRWAREA